MSPEKPSKPTKLCPTCGTRVNEDAPRCLVCGTDLTSTERLSRPEKAVQGSRMPEITLSLPAVLGLLAMFLTIGAGLVYIALRQVPTQAAAEPTTTPTETLTVTPTLSPTPPPPTITNTPEPSPTPMEYTVKLGDSCLGIALSFHVSVNSIVLENPDLAADCSNIFEGQKLLIPQPTPTPTELPTATLSAAESTEAACSKVEHTVAENDTLSSIALNYAVPMDAIREYNGLVNDTVRFGQNLVIPLCKRDSTPGPTATPTLPPPYSAPNLLLPPDGAPFTLADESVTLQWASVGTLRENESYAVTIMDVTEGQNRRLVEYVRDTKFIVPASFRPNDSAPHVMRWWVITVRQTGTNDEGNPIWEPAGATSSTRDFTWSGVSPAGTPTP
jgi:LysM repeat protein